MEEVSADNQLFSSPTSCVLRVMTLQLSVRWPSLCPVNVMSPKHCWNWSAATSRNLTAGNMYRLKWPKEGRATNFNFPVSVFLPYQHESVRRTARKTVLEVSLLPNTSGSLNPETNWFVGKYLAKRLPCVSWRVASLFATGVVALVGGSFEA